MTVKKTLIDSVPPERPKSLSTFILQRYHTSGIKIYVIKKYFKQRKHLYNQQLEIQINRNLVLE